MPTRYLTCDEVIILHRETLRRLGAPSQPLRDRDALDGALARVQQAAHYDHLALVDQAALLGIAISQAQSFVDGNKRAAVVAMIRFLDLNRFDFFGDYLYLARALELQADLSHAGDREAILEGREELASWLSNHIRPIAPSWHVIRERRGPSLNEDEAAYGGEQGH